VTRLSFCYTIPTLYTPTQNGGIHGSIPESNQYGSSVACNPKYRHALGNRYCRHCGGYVAVNVHILAKRAYDFSKNHYYTAGACPHRRMCSDNHFTWNVRKNRCLLKAIQRFFFYPKYRCRITFNIFVCQKTHQEFYLLIDA
jgi:hypothetical protein